MFSFSPPRYRPATDPQRKTAKTRTEPHFRRYNAADLLRKEPGHGCKGTSTYTDRNTFHETELYRTSDPTEIASGQVGFIMPLDTMHSFEAENNKILWLLDLHGGVGGWPDVKKSFQITVTPAAS